MPIFTEKEEGVEGCYGGIITLKEIERFEPCIIVISMGKLKHSPAGWGFPWESVKLAHLNGDFPWEMSLQLSGMRFPFGN